MNKRPMNKRRLNYREEGEKAKRDELRREAEAEMAYELAANFPRGTTVVNILTGQTYKVR